MAQGVKQTTRDVTLRFFQKFPFINQPQHWLNYVMFCFVNRVTLAAAVAWGSRSNGA